MKELRLYGLTPDQWEDAYHTMFNSQIFFIPLVIIVASYVKIFLILSRLSIVQYSQARVQVPSRYIIMLGAITQLTRAQINFECDISMLGETKAFL